MKIILYRILGNDIPTRHSSGQTIDNLRFILEYEKPHQHIEKRWILNRIFDDEARCKIVSLLKSANHKYSEIPFKESRYLQCWTDVGLMPLNNLPGTETFKRYHPATKARINEYLRREKSLYLVNNNGARNFALTSGFNDGADWVLPWDGGCFLHPSSWNILYEELSDSKQNYIFVPMVRVDDNNELSKTDLTPNADIEPQICFSKNAHLYLDPTMRYGSMPKSRLLQRIGLPGEWQEGIGHFPWESMDRRAAPDRGKFSVVGWVARLSGKGEALRLPIEPKRWVSRFDGTNSWTETVDRRILTKILAHNTTHLWSRLNKDNPPVSPRTLDYIAKSAEVTYSLSLAYLRQCSLTSSMTSPSLFGDSFPNLSNIADIFCALTLDSYLNNNQVSKQHLSRMVDTLFLSLDTSFNPQLEFFKSLSGYNGDGDVDIAYRLRNLSVLCEALALLKKMNILTEKQSEALHDWFNSLLGWLVNGQEGLRYSQNYGLLGTCYHLSILMLASFTGNIAMLDNCLNSIPRLLARQLGPDSRDTTNLGDSPFSQSLNFLSWATIAIFCSGVKKDLWWHKDSAGRSLAYAHMLFRQSTLKDDTAHKISPRQLLEHDAISDLFGHKETSYMDNSPGTFLPPFLSLCCYEGAVYS